MYTLTDYRTPELPALKFDDAYDLATAIADNYPETIHDLLDGYAQDYSDYSPCVDEKKRRDFYDFSVDFLLTIFGSMNSCDEIDIFGYTIEKLW